MQGQNFQVVEYLWGLLIRSPVILIAILGIAWALVNWRKSSTAAILTTIACSVLLLASCIFPALFLWVTQMVIRNADGEAGSRLRLTNYALIATSSLCTAFCFGSLIFAAFAGRAARAARRLDVPDEPPFRPPEAEPDRPVDERIQPS